MEFHPRCTAPFGVQLWRHSNASNRTCAPTFDLLYATVSFLCCVVFGVPSVSAHAIHVCILHHIVIRLFRFLRFVELDRVVYEREDRANAVFILGVQLEE